MSNHNHFYSYAEYYDIAFDFKNIPSECDFLSSCFEVLNKRKVSSFLELAAGPALHGLEFGRRNVASMALDLAPEMAEYGRIKAERETIELEYACVNMVEFNLGRNFDLATILMDSTSYLLDNDSVISHLNAVARHLNEGGIYVLEMSHPRDIFNVGKSADTKWDMNRDGKKVNIQWGCEGDKFDPITQVTETTVKMAIEDGDERREFEDSAPQRCFTANEFAALVQASGKFRIAEIFGAMDRSVPFDNDKKAWRMVPILQRL